MKTAIAVSFVTLLCACSNDGEYIPTADKISCQSANLYDYRNPAEKAKEFLKTDQAKREKAQRDQEFKAGCAKIAAEEKAQDALMDKVYQSCANGIRRHSDATLQLFPQTRGGLLQSEPNVEPTEGGWNLHITATDSSGTVNLICYTDKLANVIRIVAKAN